MQEQTKHSVDPAGGSSEPPAPLFGHWWIWYLIVLLALGGMIAFLYWLTQTFR